jgi:hypothetical protein
VFTRNSRKNYLFLFLIFISGCSGNKEKAYFKKISNIAYVPDESGNSGNAYEILNPIFRNDTGLFKIMKKMYFPKIQKSLAFRTSLKCGMWSKLMNKQKHQVNLSDEAIIGFSFIKDRDWDFSVVTKVYYNPNNIEKIESKTVNVTIQNSSMSLECGCEIDKIDNLLFRFGF